MTGRPQAIASAGGIPKPSRSLKERKIIVEKYLDLLNNTVFKFITIRKDTKWNYHYFPIIFKDEENLLFFEKKMNEKKIFPRRYFYPSLNKLSFLDDFMSCPESESISKRVLCLPLYVGLTKNEQQVIIDILNERR